MVLAAPGPLLTPPPSSSPDDDDVFYLFLQKQKIGAELHIYLEEGTEDPSLVLLRPNSIQE